MTMSLLSLSWLNPPSIPTSLPTSHLSRGFSQPLCPNTSLQIGREAPCLCVLVKENAGSPLALFPGLFAREAGAGLSRWANSGDRSMHQDPRAGSPLWRP